MFGCSGEVSSSPNSTIISKLDSTYVEEIMVERSKIVSVEMSSDQEEILNILRLSTHSRIPVCDGSLDKIVGFIHIKDLICNAGKVFRIRDVLRTIIYVPPVMKVSALLLKMKVARVHVAVVVDEFGATVGLVTMTDVVEQILGSIQDEHNIEPEPFFWRVTDSKFEVSARIEVKEFVDKSGLELEITDDFRTLGGYIFNLVGRIPAVNEVILSPGGIKFIILDADNTKINAVLVDATSQVQ